METNSEKKVIADPIEVVSRIIHALHHIPAKTGDMYVSKEEIIKDLASRGMEIEDSKLQNTLEKLHGHYCALIVKWTSADGGNIKWKFNYLAYKSAHTDYARSSV